MPAEPRSPAVDDDLADLLRRIDEGDETAPAPAVGAPLTKPTDVSRPERAAAAVVESEGGIEFRPVFASFGARAIGLLVDTAVLVLLTLPGGLLMLTGSTGTVLVGVALVIAGFAVATVLYARGVARTGQSVGNRVAGTTVVDARNGRFVSAGDAGVRFVIRYVVSTILFVGFLMALGNAQRRTFHDNVAGTVVTRPPRATWSIDDESPAA